VNHVSTEVLFFLLLVAHLRTCVMIFFLCLLFHFTLPPKVLFSISCCHRALFPPTALLKRALDSPPTTFFHPSFLFEYSLIPPFLADASGFHFIRQPFSSSPSEAPRQTIGNLSSNCVAFHPRLSLCTLLPSDLFIKRGPQKLFFFLPL